MVKKKNKYKMDVNMADSSLQNILKSVGQENFVQETRVEKLSLIKNANTHIYNVFIVIVAVLIAMTFIAPLTIPSLIQIKNTFFAPEPVILTDDYLINDCITLTLNGDNIQFDKAYIEYPDGSTVAALSYDTKLKTISFSYDNTIEVNIYIPVEGATPLHLLLTPIK